jgi:hypothetical protein
MMLLLLLRHLLPLLLPPLLLLLLLLLLPLLLQTDQRCPRKVVIDFSFFVDIAFVDVELWGDIYNLSSNNNQIAGSQPV